MAKMTALEIVRGISQAVSNAHDGAIDSDGEKVEIGLKREEDIDIHDRRVMDGFKVKMSGDKLILKYHSEVPLKDAHATDFEGEVKQTLQDVISFIKKEYKKVTDSALTLTKEGEVDIMLSSISRQRTWLQASQVYVIGGMDGVESVGEGSEDRLEDGIKKFLELGRETAKKPENVTRKKSDEDKK